MRDWTETQIKDQINVFLIRHGSTAANEEQRYLGKTDKPLSEKGIRELRKNTEKRKFGHRKSCL